jgi:protein SCO1/2
MMRKYLALLTLVLLAAPAFGQRVGSYGRAPAAPSREPKDMLPTVNIDQHLGDQVPLDLVFKDEQDQEVTLGSCVGGKPTILVIAYYRCEMLCNLVLNGVLEAAQKLPGNIGEDYNIVTVSFDPKDHHLIASMKKTTYLKYYGRPGAEKGWHFLTGKQASIDALCKAVGFNYEYDKIKKQFNHASGIMILTPFGKISKYYFGISYADPKDDPNAPETYKSLQTSISDASKGMVGKAIEPSEIMKFLCYEYNPVTGERSISVMKILRAIFSVFVICLGVWLVRNWRRPTRMTPVPEAKPVLDQ